MRVQENSVVLFAVAQVLGHGRRVHDLPRIHPALRIERQFHVLEGLVDLIAEEFFVQVAAGQTVSVLAAHAAAEFQYEIGNVIGHVLHDLDFAAVSSC